MKVLGPGEVRMKVRRHRDQYYHMDAMQPPPGGALAADIPPVEGGGGIGSPIGLLLALTQAS